MKTTIAELLDAGAKVDRTWFKFVPPESYRVHNGAILSVLDTDKIIDLSNQRIEKYRKSIRFAKKLYDTMLKKHKSVCEAIETLRKEKEWMQ